MMRRRLNIAEAVAITGQTHGAYVVHDGVTGMGTSVLATARMALERKVLLVGANRQVVRQAMSRLAGADLSPVEHPAMGGLVVACVRGRNLSQVDPKDFDVVVFDELHNEQRAAASELAKRFRQAGKSVVEHRNQWQIPLLKGDDPMIIHRYASGEVVIGAKEMSEDLVEALDGMQAAYSLDAKEAPGTEWMVAARNELVSARLLSSFGHWGAVVTHAVQAVDFAAKANSEVEMDSIAKEAIGDLRAMRIGFEMQPWTIFDEAKVENAMAEVESYVRDVENSLKPEATIAPGR